MDTEGVPHMATDAGEYNGYYIPKGTVMIGNLWSVRTIPPSPCPDFLSLGPYYTTLKFLATLWTTSLNGT